MRPTATGLPPLPANPDDIQTGTIYHYRNLRVWIPANRLWIAGFDLPYEAGRTTSDYDKAALIDRVRGTIDSSIERAHQLGDDYPWARPWPPQPPPARPEYDPPQTWEDTEREWADNLKRIQAGQTTEGAK